MAQAPDTVVPNSLNYTDIKPQAIENKIQLCRYQPTAMVTGAKGGDMIKFLLSGNGCLDPYSTYFQFIVQVDDLVLTRNADNTKDIGEVRWLDRSAHSFFQRIVIRSQGVELERIEHYDVIAAMINDMLYSPEQCSQHYWEAFPTHVWDGKTGGTTDYVNADTKQVEVDSSLQLFRIDGGNEPKAVLDAQGAIAKGVGRSVHIDARDELLRWLCQGASPSVMGYVGETCFHNLPQIVNVESVKGTAATVVDHTDACPTDFDFLPDHQFYSDMSNGTPRYDNANGYSGSCIWSVYDWTNQANILYPTSFAYHIDGRRIPAGSPVYKSGITKAIQPAGTKRMQFIVPIYSGLIGLLMPEKKLLPLNLLPLDIEIVFNPHALYSSRSDGNRNYRIQEFYIYGNTLFFEQEIHRTLEASVADHGLFLYCNSFHSAPVQLISNQSIPSALYISMNLKSINSVHWVFMYNHFETIACARKLHFVSHNISRMQLLNGTQLIPQYPVQGSIDGHGMGSSNEGQQLQFIIELYKAWNKMHDPSRDGSHHAYNTCGDQYCGQMDPIFDYTEGRHWTLDGKAPQDINLAAIGITTATMLQIANKQGNVGRCQYGISLEGEELGSDKTMITGRKSQYPFQIQLLSHLGKCSPRPSYMLPFLRADFIVYIRPDLQIVTLGK